MKFSHKIVVAGICLVAGVSAFADIEKSSAIQVTATMQPAIDTESSLPESTVEQDDDWLAAHESNGPEGARGVDMQRMSPIQITLVLAIFSAGGGLVMLARKPEQPPKS